MSNNEGYTDSPTVEESSSVHTNSFDDEMAERADGKPQFVSIHRRNLERISTDAVKNHKHTVPEGKGPTRRESWAQKSARGLKENISQRTPIQWLETFIPMAKWLRVYDWRTAFVKDLIAGITVGVMIIPQSMSYAKLAGLPVEFGLYSALMPLYVYAVFGSSRQLAVGPVALVSLLLSTGLSDILSSMGLQENTPEYETVYKRMAIQVAFLVGVTYIIMGLLRLGFVTIFLSHAVVSGFTTGASVIIGMSQIKYIFGYDFPKSSGLHITLKNIVNGIENFNWKTFLMGMGSIFALVFMKNLARKNPKFKWFGPASPLVVTVVTILITYVLGLENKGIAIVKSIPKGLPPVTVNEFTPIDEFSKVVQVVLSITIVGFMESIAIAKQLAAKHKYELDSSLELIGLGMANFAGAVFNSYPVTGSFSRSAVNNETGAVSGISGVVTATIVAFVLLFLTPVFERMPLAVLAAVIISGVLRLLDWPEAMYLWKVHKFDFFVWLIACLGTMFLGVEIGLGIAVGVSLLLVTYESAYPNTCVLGRLPGSTVYRNIKQYPGAERYDGIVMVRVDAPIYFANTQNVREKLQKYEKIAEEELTESNGGEVKFIIWELSPVPHIDTSALHILSDMIATYKDRGIQLCFANPTVPVMNRFLSSGLVDEVGREHIFVTTHDAVNWCLDHMDAMALSVQESPEEDIEAIVTKEDA